MAYYVHLSYLATSWGCLIWFHRKVSKIMDPVSLLRGAAQTLSPNDAASVLRDSRILFNIGGTWYAFRDVRAARRAVRWLAENSLIDDDVADRYLAGHPDPVLP